MDQDRLVWPRKTRELFNHHMDSTAWNDFRFRDDDVIVATYAKSGTTWTQQIVSQLIFAGAEGVPVHEISPWLDLRIMPPDTKATLEAQQHRRVIKTHLPLDALTFSPRAKYLYIARDGRDVVWSFYNHHSNANPLFYELINNTPGRVGPPIERPDPDIRRYFRTWLERDGYPFWSYWENIATWWAAREVPNILLIHFNDLKTDLEGEMRRIARFLGCDIAEERWPTILHHCSFDYMKSHAASVAPLGGAIFEEGAGTFINKGVNGRWRDVLSAEEIASYERMAVRKLGPECAEWLARGTRAAPDAPSRDLAA
ncbi:sulfotransferase domain-containing protein [Sphingosinicella sp. CPCC 101087]|uniref:sulfotransferase domain-containing protein n=1 Tax=Sphingosinicella sp. CPCC 101087 TaxID=2497754 RepID=UPI0019804895|nr:sulfotransferase domain-containing protein [Sphingosinicella sp. CPCC 101087]